MNFFTAKFYGYKDTPDVKSFVDTFLVFQVILSKELILLYD